MILPLVQLPDERLHQSSPALILSTIKTSDFQSTLKDFHETMVDAKGVGIAGVQVGYCFQVFLAMNNNKPVYLLNPELIWHGDSTTLEEEGCLSVPGTYGKVERFASVRMKGLNERGIPVEIKARGYFARILQHEFDHLQGTLFVDRLAQKAL